MKSDKKNHARTPFTAVIVPKLRLDLGKFNGCKGEKSLKQIRKSKVKVDLKEMVSNDSYRNSEQEQKKERKIKPLQEVEKKGFPREKKTNVSTTVEREKKTREKPDNKQTKSKNKKVENKKNKTLKSRPSKKQERLKRDNQCKSSTSSKVSMFASLKQINKELKDTFAEFEQVNLKLSDINKQLGIGFVEYDCMDVNAKEKAMNEDMLNSSLKSFTDFCSVLSEQTKNHTEFHEQGTNDWNISKLVKNKKSFGRGGRVASESNLQFQDLHETYKVKIQRKRGSKNKLQKEQFEVSSYLTDHDDYLFLSDSSYSSDLDDDALFDEERIVFVASLNPIIKCDPYKLNNQRSHTL